MYWLSPFTSPFFSHGAFTNKTTVNSWAAKVAFKLNDSTNSMRLPSRILSCTNGGYGIANEDTFSFYPQLNSGGQSNLGHWNYGTRSETFHLTGSLSPTWQLDISASAKRSYFTKSPVDNDFIEDFSGVVQAALFYASGLTFVQNPVTTNSA